MRTQSIAEPLAAPTPDTLDSRLAARAHRVFAATIARNTLRDCLDGAPTDALALVERYADQSDLRAIAHGLLRERAVRS